MFKKSRVVATVLITGLALLTGCGTSNPKTKDGIALISQLDYEGALAAFDAAQEAGENQRQIHRARGIALMGQTNYEEAVTEFETALSLSNGFLKEIDYDINYYLAAALTKLERYEEAEARYNAILSMRRGEETAKFLRGNVRLKQGKYEAAAEDYDSVIAASGKNYDRLFDIFQTLEACGYRTAGEEYLRAALNSDDGSMSQLDKGKIYYFLREYQSAAVCLEEARKNTTDAEGSLYLGRSYEAVGEYNYASNVYESYLAKDETNPAVYNQLGLCKMEMKDYKGALSAFQQGMQLEDDSCLQSLSFNEIVAYEYLGEFRKAYVLIGNYLSMYPDDEAAKREKIFLSTR